MFLRSDVSRLDQFYFIYLSISRLLETSKKAEALKVIQNTAEVQRDGFLSLVVEVKKDQSVQDETLLRLCSRFGAASLCQYLIDKGADPLLQHKGHDYASVLAQAAAYVEQYMETYKRACEANGDMPVAEREADVVRFRVLSLLLVAAVQWIQCGRRFQDRKEKRMADYAYAVGVWNRLPEYRQLAPHHVVRSDSPVESRTSRASSLASTGGYRGIGEDPPGDDKIEASSTLLPPVASKSKTQPCMDVVQKMLSCFDFLKHGPNV